MSDASKIEWTDATWNPVTGCTEVSPGCDRCYAKTLAERFRGTPGHYFERGFDVVLRPERLDQPLRWTKPRRIFVNSMSDLFHADIPDEYIARVFAVMALAPQHTFQVLTKRHGRMRSLLNSGAFADQVEHAIAGLVFDDTSTVKISAEQHDTAYRHVTGSRVIVTDPMPPLPNVWLGVSVEDQKRAELRIPALADTPAVVRFLSCEPLLSPLDLTAWLPRPRDPFAGGVLGWLSQGGRCDFQPGNIHGARSHVTALCRQCTNGRRISWVIVGGESGHGARPMHPVWVRDLRDQCTAGGVAFHFKQWGEWAPSTGRQQTQGFLWPAGELETRTASLAQVGPTRKAYVADEAPTRPGWVNVERVGKRHSGRMLDGRTWDEFPAYDPTDGSIVTVGRAES